MPMETVHFRKLRAKPVLSPDDVLARRAFAQKCLPWLYPWVQLGAIRRSIGGGPFANQLRARFPYG